MHAVQQEPVPRMLVALGVPLAEHYNLERHTLLLLLSYLQPHLHCPKHPHMEHLGNCQRRPEGAALAAAAVVVAEERPRGQPSQVAVHQEH